MLDEIDQFVNWVRRRNPEARTWRDYQYDLSQFAALMGDRSPNEITFRDIAGSIRQIPPLPAGLTGRVLLTERAGETRLVMANLDGSQRQEYPSPGGGGALSPDGQKVAYLSADGIAVLDVAANTSTVLMDQTESRIIWSLDGPFLAYVSSTELNGLYVVPASLGSAPRQLSNIGYESLAGWSPDGRLIHYTIPNEDNHAAILRSVDVLSGATQDRLILENMSPKTLLSAISPDGKWIAYRAWVAYPADEGSSLYIKAMDGQSPTRLLIDNPGMASMGK